MPSVRLTRTISMGADMGAGSGAAEQAKLAAERAAKLRRQLEYAERSERAWAAGAAGEVRVAAILESLHLHGWLVLHDVHWPGRPKANLDHVLIGPGGVIVVDTKNWSGDVLLRNGILRQNGYPREREVSGALQQGAAVAALLEPQHRRLVQAWLCMVGQPVLQGLTASNVRIQGIDTLHDAVLALQPVLDANTVTTIHQYVSNLLAGGGSPALLTTGNLSAGLTDFTYSSGPATSLAQWRTARDPADNSRARRPRVTTQRHTLGAKKLGCLGVFFRLALIIFALGVFLNVLSQVSSQPQRAPVPAPAIVTAHPEP